MEIVREDFVKILEKMQMGISGTDLVPAFRCFRIKDNSIMTMDGSISIKADFGFKTDLDCTIPARLFLNLLKSLKVKKVSIIQRRGCICVHTNKVEGTFAIVEKENPMEIPNYENVVWEDFPSNLIDALDICRFSVSKDETKGVLCGVNLGAGYVYGTDGFRIMRYKYKENEDLVGCILPLRFIGILLSLASDGVTGYCIRDTQFLVRLKNNIVVSTTLLVGSYVKCEQFFETSGRKIKELSFPKNFKDVVNRHIEFQKEMPEIDRELTVKIDSSICILTSVMPEAADLKEEVELEKDVGTKFSFMLNPMFLKKILTYTSDFYYDDEAGLVRFKTGFLEYLAKTKEIKN